MAPVEVIDLVSDEEDELLEESPRRRAVLTGFEPRKEKVINGNSSIQHHHSHGQQTNGQIKSTVGESYHNSTTANGSATNGNHGRVNGSGQAQSNLARGSNGQNITSSDRLAVLSEPLNWMPTRTVSTETSSESFRNERIDHFARFHEKQSMKSASPTHGLPVDFRLPWKAQETRGQQIVPSKIPNLQPLDRSNDKGGRSRPIGPSRVAQSLPPTKNSSSAAANGVKRSAPAAVHRSTPEHDVKRARTDNNGANVPVRRERPMVAPVDVTNHDAERISYSDEPVLPQGSTSDLNVLLPSEEESVLPPAPALVVNSAGPSRNGLPYSTDEDCLLKKLKEEAGLSWIEMVPLFHGRTAGSLQVRWYTKIKNTDASNARPKRQRASEPVVRHGRGESPHVAEKKRVRKSNIADGFVSWASLKQKHDVDIEPDRPTAPREVDPTFQQDTAFPRPLSAVLRQRELGMTTRRAWTSTRTVVTEEARNHVLKDYRLQKQYHGTSGDVVALSWSPKGYRFAAGSIAISDDRSMQYNMQRNLLLGDQNEVRELTEHHIQRPTIEDDSNINARQAMRQTQDPRLFMTVTAAGFSVDGKLFTAGTDKMLRQYSVNGPLELARCRYAIQHSASIDLLAVHPRGKFVATGCHTSTEDPIIVFNCYAQAASPKGLFSPARSNADTQAPIFPSSLKWGVAHQHQRMLLAGFSGDSEKQLAGETCLWEVEVGKKLELHATTRNVFDLAWNPIPSSASICFVVASNPSNIPVKRDTRTVIQCFAPGQGGASRILTWECPAADINDVVMCPHDNNLIAAGATNGRVYVWDIRGAARSQEPLHVLKHGSTENVVDHDRDLETADTGIRFLSWGATKSRLYSGSSDGVVKVWNPFRSIDNTLVDEIAAPAHQRSAIMSGAFNQDYRSLLVGTENGRIDLFEAGSQAVYKTPQFRLRPPKTEAERPEAPYAVAKALVKAGQIVFKPCGAMPFRQAVQGPDYETLSFDKDKQHAQNALNRAMLKQMEASDEEQISKAKTMVQEAEAWLHDISEREQHFISATPKAEAFQRSLLRNERERLNLVLRLPHPPEACELDCSVLRGQDQDEEAEDSGRSTLRIPEVLRTNAKNAASTKIYDEEQAAPCFKCQPHPKNRGKYCAKCSLQMRGLTAQCVKCSEPARVPTDGTRPVCERCSFSCFRCGQAAALSPDMKRVHCSACSQAWTIGALGYELANLTLRPRKKDLGAQDSDNDLGDEEREHYAGFVQQTTS